MKIQKKRIHVEFYESFSRGKTTNESFKKEMKQTSNS